MLCTTCSRDVSWIEIHYKSKHKFSLSDYLQENFAFHPTMIKNGQIYCEYCDTYVTWLQAHLKQYHKAELKKYLGKHFRVKPERKAQLIQSIAQATKQREKREKIKREAMARFKAGKQENLVVKYQTTLKQDRQAARSLFKEIFKVWEPRIATHAYSNAHSLLSLSKEEACQDLKQELCEAFFESLRTYDPGRGVAFSTYAYRCIQNKALILRSIQETKRRKVIEVFAEFNSSSKDSDDFSGTSLEQKLSQQIWELKGAHSDLESKIVFDQIKFTDTEREIVEMLKKDYTKKEVSERLGITSFKLTPLLKSVAKKINATGVRNGIC